MKQFLPEELAQFLQKIDEFLTRDCNLIVIGGAAAALAYGATKATTDIDLATALPEHLKTAIGLAITLVNLRYITKSNPKTQLPDWPS